MKIVTLVKIVLISIEFLDPDSEDAAYEVCTKQIYNIFVRDIASQ